MTLAETDAEAGQESPYIRLLNVHATRVRHIVSGLSQRTTGTFDVVDEVAREPSTVTCDPSPSDCFGQLPIADASRNFRSNPG